MLNADKVIAEARAKVGLERFASPDSEANLRRLADALNREGRLNPAGEHRIHVAGVYHVCTQLLLGQYLTAKPELADADAGNAIMIVGLPRTGSTKLFRLISQDPRLMHLTLGDVALPLAFPGETGVEIRQPLIARMQAELGMPQLMAAHELIGAEPEEEVILQLSHFDSRMMNDQAAMPEWQAEVRARDSRPRHVLQRQLMVAHMTQTGKTGWGWSLKNAYAGEDIDVIAEVFPNAKFVFTHRDPLEQFTSIMALGHQWRAIQSDAITKEQSGQDYLQFWGEFIRRMLAATRKVSPERIIHVRYPDVVKNPISTIREIHRFAGLEVDEAVLDGMREYDATHVQHAHGKHSYSLDEFGLTPADVEGIYADYLALHGDKI